MLKGPQRRRYSIIGVALLGLGFILSSRAAGAAPPISYTIDLGRPGSHRVGVTMTVAQARAATEIQFPAWNALYQIRDFVRHVENVQAECGGAPLALTPVDLDTWTTGAQECSPLLVRYQVYADEPGVFSSELVPDHAYLNLAQILFYIPRERDRPSALRFILPPGWKLITLLAGAGPEFTAPGYDALVDSPVEAGLFQLYSFSQDGALYRITVRGSPADYSSTQLMESIEKIAATETTLMRSRPCARYTFIFHFPEAGGGAEGGGMEHACGAAIGFPAPLIESGWAELENTIAHEFFHLWNVKRIRPQGLDPVDYVHGNDTRDLWFSEGVTSTYAELALLRAGLMSRNEFYAHLAQAIEQLQQRPARHFQSAELSGMDAWLEKYPDYDRSDRSISYYNKGELLGYLLDLEILHASGAAHSLDDLMRQLNVEFAERGRFFTDADLESIIAALGPSPAWAQSFFEDDVTGTRELDYQKFLGYAGLRLSAQPSVEPDWGFEAARDFNGTIRVATVEASSGAAQAGIETGDVLTAVDGQKLYALPQNVEGVKPGQRVKLEVMRASRPLTLKFSLGSRRETSYSVGEMPGATPEEIEIRDGWLTGQTGRTGHTVNAGGAGGP
ncbi:MAG: M61 family metallopeptidase [Terriglobia bacterium]